MQIVVSIYTTLIHHMTYLVQHTVFLPGVVCAKYIPGKLYGKHMHTRSLPCACMYMP